MSNSSFKPYDPMNDKERMEYWKTLLEGKKLKRLIEKEDKSAYGMGGVKKTNPGYIGFVLENDDGSDLPIYIHPGAFGDSYGTFIVYFNHDNKPDYNPEEE